MLKKVAFGLSLVLAGLLLVWMLGDGRLHEAFSRLIGIPAWVAATVIGSQAFSYFCRARRIAGEFSQSAPLPFTQFLRISLLHNFSVNIIPFRGGELMLPYLLRRAGIPGARAVTTLIWLRVQDALVLGSIALLLWPGIALFLRSTAILGIFLGVVIFRHTARRLRAPQAYPGLQKWFDALTAALDAPLASWGWSISNWLAKLAGQAVLLVALASAALNTGALGTLGGELSAMLPVQGVGGFGTYEAGVAFGLSGGQGDWLRYLVPAFALHLFTLLFAAASGILAWIALPDALPAAAPGTPEKA